MDPRIRKDDEGAVEAPTLQTVALAQPKWKWERQIVSGTQWVNARAHHFWPAAHAACLLRVLSLLAGGLQPFGLLAYGSRTSG